MAEETQKLQKRNQELIEEHGMSQGLVADQMRSLKRESELKSLEFEKLALRIAEIEKLSAELEGEKRRYAQQKESVNKLEMLTEDLKKQI